MPNFHSLKICERPDFRLIIHVPKNVSAKDLREPEEPDQPYEDPSTWNEQPDSET